MRAARVARGAAAGLVLAAAIATGIADAARADDDSASPDTMIIAVVVPEHAVGPTSSPSPTSPPSPSTAPSPAHADPDALAQTGDQFAGAALFAAVAAALVGVGFAVRRLGRARTLD
ncbi:hypothetical protein [Microbacterium dextranolyticum]|uniref:Gram-positive cocci surface proteins LPxTG domain-containing protein n=1 Tax=Microbacterium dextranolyticum TaxID=36806 RepID=A0A9W6HLJ7_9MICO|nr:hypothetical protein [Microbacterium dextranolyticum]MBM7463879.1 hypothetical protein [Microbacterium dextranolyticum]GLJ94961.1 hypothetical protein GCM10017591_10230 [Microbacterium dextranolyticum]